MSTDKCSVLKIGWNPNRMDMVGNLLWDGMQGTGEPCISMGRDTGHKCYRLRILAQQLQVSSCFKVLK